MRSVQRSMLGGALLAATITFTSTPAAVLAQDTVPAAEAEAFIGSWELPLQTDMGEFEVSIDIQDADGQVMATVGSLEGSAPVESISKDGEALVFDFSMDAQGQMMPVVMVLTPEGDELAVSVDVAQGMFIANGTATRMGS